MFSIHQRMKTVCDPPVDIISDLPGNIIETILMCLPLRDAVRTSVLSRRWRYNWVNIPKLVFDDTLFQGSNEKELCSDLKLKMIVYEVLLLHRGPILEFTVNAFGSKSHFGIEKLVAFLSWNGVEKFTLHFAKRQFYKLPPSFFSCLLQLRHLNLRSCVFTPPPVFRGFSRLLSLEFTDVTIDDFTFATLISNCPLLEHLTVEGSTNFDCLYIDVHTLKSLCIGTTFYSLSLRNSPSLASVAITSDIPEDYFGKSDTSNIIEVFGCLPAVEKLIIRHCFLKFLVAGAVPINLPMILNHLKILELYQICLWELDEVAVALCLLNSSPNLEKVLFEVFPSTSPISDSVVQLIEAQQCLDFSLNRLREVQMWSVSGARPEMELIKLLLAKSTVLEKLVVGPYSKKVAQKHFAMLKELTRFKRASIKAEIIYDDSNSDQF